jgi:hypothetical protein
VMWLLDEPTILEFIDSMDHRSNKNRRARSQFHWRAATRPNHESNSSSSCAWTVSLCSVSPRHSKKVVLRQTG